MGLQSGSDMIATITDLSRKRTTQRFTQGRQKTLKSTTMLTRIRKNILNTLVGWAKETNKRKKEHYE